MRSRDTWDRLIIPGIIAAIIAGLVSGLLVPWVNVKFGEGKITRDIRKVIEQEANLALEGSIDEAVSLFDKNAFVRDAAGGNKDQEIVWNGVNNIADRYRNLPEFIYLKHEATEITISSDRTYARATADTIGTYIDNGREIKISGNQGEKWTFEKIDGEWKITSFTYNLP